MVFRSSNPDSISTMSFFPTADPERLRAAMAQNQALYQTPTTPSTPSFSDSKPNDDNEVTETWSASGASNPAAFSGPEAIPWPSQYAQGLGLDHVPTPTQSSFGTSYPVTSPYPPNSAWAPNPVSLAPSCVYPELTAQGTSMDFCYSMATPTMPSSASWDTPAPTSSIFPPTYEGSPGRSDYSENSQQSFVESSPYAHSDDFLQTSDSPFIKVEEQSEYIRPRLYSVPGLMSEQPSHVNPGDIYASPPLSAFDHSNSPYHVSPKVEEENDFKPYVRHQRQQRPHNRRAFSDDTIEVVEDRQKRGYTTHANSTCHCDQCGKLFQRSYNLKAHMETHDPHREQPHCCPHPGCKRRFVRRTDLTRHEQSVHLKERKFSCPLCHNSFARKDTLRRHVDDGCPRRPEVKKRYEKMRSGSESYDPDFGSAAAIKSEGSR